MDIEDDSKDNQTVHDDDEEHANKDIKPMFGRFPGYTWDTTPSMKKINVVVPILTSAKRGPGQAVPPNLLDIPVMEIINKKINDSLF